MGEPTNPYLRGLERNAANYVPLTPLTFLARSAAVFPDRLAVLHGERRYSWAESYRRCRQLASALKGRGIGKNDTVAVMAPNVPELFEAHFGVPMIGAVLNALNVRLDAETIAFILQHGEAKVLITDREFAPVIEKALGLMAKKPLVIDIDDALAPSGQLLGEMDYERFLATGDPDFAWENPGDEWDAIALNYTSGTTGNPKGVVYHHRGAYLNALGNVLAWGMAQHPVYLWTLPMFHCNGWCFPWTVTALAGTHVCLRRVEATSILAAIAEHGVTHLCGAPIVMNMLVHAPSEVRRDFGRRLIQMMTADAATLAPVPQDGETMGEVFMRGNVVMKGYLKNEAASSEAFAGGWFHTGDLGGAHLDGYIELKDRYKDIIISGGENISTIEVESVLYRHPAVLEAAVVARPDATWGETPCAFVSLKPGATVTAEEIIAFCRQHMAHY